MDETIIVKDLKAVWNIIKTSTKEVSLIILMFLFFASCVGILILGIWLISFLMYSESKLKGTMFLVIVGIWVIGYSVFHFIKIRSLSDKLEDKIFTEKIFK